MKRPASWIVPDWPAPARVRAFVTTREGGVSAGEHGSLNLGMRCGDDPERVAANRRAVESHLPARPAWLVQMHGTAVADLDQEGEASWGTLDDNAPDRRVRRADGQFSAVRRRPVFDLDREFLPHPQPSEVEIAFISLASVTGDLISIGAQRSGKQIVYRIVDEYGTNFRFHPTQSVQPLSLGELISMIDYATGHLVGARGLTNAYRDHNLDGCDAEDLVDFVTVSSDFYPALRAYYEDQARAWLARRAAKRRERNEQGERRRLEPGALGERDGRPDRVRARGGGRSGRVY